MASLLRDCLFAVLLMLVAYGCSGSGSPVTPGGQSEADEHAAAVRAALDGVKILNTDLLSIAVNGRELLPWGIRDAALAREGSFSLDIVLSDPNRKLRLEVTGAVLLVDGTPTQSFEGPSTAVFSISEIQERVTIHLELPGEPTRRRDITVRTRSSEDLLLPDRPATVQYIDPGTDLSAEAAERELLVGFKPGVPLEIIEALVGALDSEILRAIPNIGVYRLRIPPGETYKRMADLFESSAIVEFAEINRVLCPAMIPNDTYEHHEYGNGVMRLYDAWDITTGTSDTTIAFVDSGVMRDHPDLYQNVIPGEDFIWPIGDGLGGETPGDGVDNDVDGLTDEVVGHGTHCAGIAGAVGNNSEGVSGHSWSSRILPLRVFPTDGDSGAWTSDVAEAITYAADHGQQASAFRSEARIPRQPSSPQSTTPGARDASLSRPPGTTACQVPSIRRLATTLLQLPPHIGLTRSRGIQTTGAGSIAARRVKTSYLVFSMYTVAIPGPYPRMSVMYSSPVPAWPARR